MMALPAAICVLLLASSGAALSTPKDGSCSLQAPPGPLLVDVPQEREAANAAPHPKRALCTPLPAAATGSQTTFTCSNWAGSVAWRPAALVTPGSEEELSTYLRDVAAAADAVGSPRPKIKVVGYAHSWAGLYVPDAGADGTPGVTISLHRLTGITALSSRHVEVLAGTSFAQLYDELSKHGLTLAWSPGGIKGLTVGGAVSVGFHGSQQSLGGVSSVVSALRLVDTQGRTHDLTDAADPQGMRAARLCAGQCGVLTRVTLPVAPEFHLRRRRWRLDDAERFLTEVNPQLKARHDRYHWYAHPATGSWWPMLWEPTSEAEAAADAPCKTASEQAGDAAMKEFGVDGLPLIMRWDNCSDVSHRALTHAVDMEEQPLWNGEMYVPLDDAGEAAASRAILAAFARVAAARGGAGARPNPDIWLHARYVGGDTGALMNPCFGHQTCVAWELALVAPAMDAALPAWEEWDAYFSAMVDVLQPLGGRPHHAKYMRLRDPPAQPQWGLPLDAFRQQAARFDPHRQLSSAGWDAVWGAGAGAGATA